MAVCGYRCELHCEHCALLRCDCCCEHVSQRVVCLNSCAAGVCSGDKVPLSLWICTLVCQCTLEIALRTPVWGVAERFYSEGRPGGA